MLTSGRCLRHRLVLPDDESDVCQVQKVQNEVRLPRRAAQGRITSPCGHPVEQVLAGPLLVPRKHTTEEGDNTGVGKGRGRSLSRGRGGAGPGAGGRGPGAGGRGPGAEGRGPGGGGGGRPRATDPKPGLAPPPRTLGTYPNARSFPGHTSCTYVNRTNTQGLNKACTQTCSLVMSMS
jgi:hypothetical protein